MPDNVQSAGGGFMDYQTATYGQPKRKRTAPQQPQQPQGGTPWMPNGQPQPAPQQAQPQQQAQPAPQPSQAQTGSPGEGWIPIAGGGWVPPGHPLAEQQKQSQAASPTVQYQQQPIAGSQMYQPLQQGDPRLGNAGNVDNQGVYHAGQAPAYVYNPQQIQQFHPQNNPQIDQQQQQLMQQLLGSPQSMSPQVMDQMKGSQRDAAVLLGQQQQGVANSNLAGRGIDINQGQGAMVNRQIQGDMGGNILNAIRGIDIQGAQTNHQDLLNAIGAGTDFQNAQTSRNLSNYGATLQGQQAQGGEQQNFLNSLLQNFQAQQGALGLQAQTQQGAMGQQLQGQQLAQQGNQFSQNFGLDQSKFDYQKQMDERNFGAAQSAQSAANGRWADEQAMNFQLQQQQEQDSLLQYLLGQTQGY